MAGFMPSRLSGSYDPSDVIFLLKEVNLAPTRIVEKEALIQSGLAHYSEMISRERRPDKRYMEIYESALACSGSRIAREIITLARLIAARITKGDLNAQITLCSLVRAGIPYGILLHRELTALGVDSVHYGISIIRDRGLDHNAMAYVMATRPAEGIVFVDGWTGKGAISAELNHSWHEISGLKPEFTVLADPSGHAGMSGSHEDWLIPSGLLGANVSGLISRSILNSTVIEPEDFHGTVRVGHLESLDVSRGFVDHITHLAQPLRANPGIAPADYGKQAKARIVELRATATACVNRIVESHGIDNLNRIKPGIAEATRAVLRRRPHKVFLQNAEDPDLAALVHLCQTDRIEMEICAETTGPWRAITLIKQVS